jgi:salicylate hydroxylase
LTDLPLLIAGGGIGGLTAALALAASGIRSHVLERNADLAASGAGIQIPPNAGRILRELGLDGAVAERASEPDAIVVRNTRGKLLATMPLGPSFRQRYGVSYRTIHRSDLLEVLSSAARENAFIEVTTGSSIRSFKASDSRGTALFQTDRGPVELDGTALIGADGVHSAVRQTLGGSDPTSTGYAAWRAVVAVDRMPAALPHDSIGLWLGPSAHIVHYPVRHNREFNIVVVAPHPPGIVAPDFAVVRHELHGLAEPLCELLAIDADWQCWPITTVAPGQRWSSGTVTLLGDAAHAMPPFLAQGGAMAIEDAAILAQSIAATAANLATAFERYETARRERVARVCRAAARTAAIYHLGPVAAPFRNAAIKLVGGRRLLDRYDWIYRWEAPSNEMRRP